MTIETVGNRVRQIRRELGDPSQEAFGKPLGVSKSAVGQWENDQTKLSAGKLLLIEIKYGYRARWVQFGELPKLVKELDGNEPSNVSTGPPPTPIEQSILDLLRGLTPEQQEDAKRGLEETNRKNEEIFKALSRKSGK